MIVRQFLQWIRNAVPGDRAEATAALARAYLYSDLSVDDRAAAEGAMIMLLDDPSPLVRRALAEALASAEEAPRVVVHALAGEQPYVALPVLERSPLLGEADLVDLVATARAEAQAAIARRAPLPRTVAAALAEVGSAQACLALLENPDADIASFSIDRIVDRFGHLASIRETLLARPDLPTATRQTLLSKLSQALAGFVVSRQWLEPAQAEHAAREACEKATIALAAETPGEELGELVAHLRRSGQLTAAVILRALLSGNVAVFEEALAELSGLPVDRVVGFIHDRSLAAFRALYEKAGLPRTAFPAFRAAVTAMREGALLGEPGNAARLRRGMVERVLAACAAEQDGAAAPLLALLRRFAVEAARDEARSFCEDLIAPDALPQPHAIGPMTIDARLVA
ncbi:MAG: DUF2336 domain-containing protein [Pseudolabrys sp.]|nr:DUF2336 domain-containing protein [Pseudolabrys sp.]